MSLPSEWARVVYTLVDPPAPEDLATSGILGSRVAEPITEITAWLDGTPMGVVPITQGEVVESAGGELLSRLEFTLPATPEWMPRDPGHALAPFGQELLVRRGFRLPDGSEDGWQILGRFRIRTTEPEDGWLTVTADSIDVRLVMARFIIDTTTTGTLAAQAQQLCRGIVPITINAPDRNSPSRTWEAQTNRREALLELCDAWGCVLRMVDGRLTIMPTPKGDVPDVTVRSGAGGTLVSVVPERLSDPVPNVAVASSAPEDPATPVVTAMAVTPYGPRAWDGPYGQVVTFYASPVIDTIEHAQLAAQTFLTRLQSKASDFTVTALTDPRTRLDSIRRAVDGPTNTDVVGRVVEVTHALTAGKEPGRFRAQFVTGQVESPPLEPVAPEVRPRRLALRPIWSGTWLQDSFGASRWAPGYSDLGQGFFMARTGYGAAWWGRLPTNVIEAKLILIRGQFGAEGAVTPTMRLLAPKATPPTTAAPALATVTGPPLKPGEPMTWPLPAAWVAQINAGTAAGVGIGGSSVPPMLLLASGLGMTLTLTVTE